jgi:type IV pilus assembly protein PilO
MAAQPKRPSRGNWLVTAPLVGLTVGFLFVFYLPNKKALRELSNELELKQQVVAQSNQTAAQMLATEQQVRETRQFVEAWREIAPAGSGSSALLGDISRLAKAAGVRTTRFEPSPAVEHQQLRQTPLAIGCGGSFAQVYQLLLGIEKLPQSVWMDELKIERKEKNKGDLQCELKLVIFADKSKNSD